MDAKKEKTYRPYMIAYMSHLHGIVYDKKYEFEDEELYDCTPDSILEWMTFKMYGKYEYTDFDNPLLRSSTLAMCKKSISYFMPHSEHWNGQSHTGNPTKSKLINSFIKHIKLLEVRKEGVLSCAKRALTQIEFRTALTILSTKNSFQLRYRIPCMMKLQYHLITRGDDLGHFKTRDLKGHADPLYSLFCLQMQVFWSKNVLEERDCPDQILLGSMDAQFCFLMSLSIYLEYWFTSGNGLHSTFLFSDDNNLEKAPNRTKTAYSATLRKEIFSTDEFFTMSNSQVTKSLGSHSLRKFPATWASRNDCNTHEIGIRGRWKRHSGRVVDRYIDVEQQYSDAKV